ncbi:MAG: alpha-mannosidase [Anaerolineae bacterium]|jgi:alpha-mannosidase
MLDTILDAIRPIRKALEKAQALSDWRFCQGAANGAADPAYDDSGWEMVQPGTTWAGAAGEVWLRRKLRFEDTVAGIETGGASVELPFIVPIHSEVYVDGELRRAEPSWLDTRAVPLVVCDAYAPGQEIQIAVHAFGGDGFGLFLPSGARVSSLADALWDLDVLEGQIRFTHYLAYESADANEAWQRAWNEAAAVLDREALATANWEAWRASCQQALERLAPMQAAAKSYVTHLVGHSHIDMNWLWTWDETVGVVQRDFVAADGLMARYGEFHFSQSQASTYQAMAENAPEVLEAVKRRVAEGRWEVTANSWVEGDLNMALGESLARHLLHTRRYVRETFGMEPRICWEPDTFGHVGTLPQLLQQAGVDRYYFCRAGRGEPLFWWEGIDGSRVLAFNDFLGYNGVVTPDAVLGPTLDLARRHGLRRGLYLYGVGDHGGGATARDIEAALRLDETPFLPRAQMSTLDAFYSAVEEAGVELPVIQGELNTTFEGCYTSHGDTKAGNRRSETTLLTAETLQTLAASQTGYAYRNDELAKAWKTTLFHQFHDILCGCSIGATYDDAVELLDGVVADANQMANEAAQALAGAVDTGSGEGQRIVVWNPLAWERTDLVRIPRTSLEAVPTALVDDRGVRLPVQTDGDELLFVAEAMPALGCRVYCPSQEPASAGVSVADDGTLANGILSMHVHPRSGAIDSLVDLENERVVDTMSTWRGVERKQTAGLINRLQVYWEQPHPMSAWNIGDITRVDSLIQGADVAITERGPVRATVEARRRFGESTIVQRYRLCVGLRRIDIDSWVDWRERGGKDVDAPMLRATFKPNLGPTKATFEVAYAGLERNPTGDEVPALRWADISDGEYGLTLLNDSKYGHSAQGTTLAITLLRSSYEPDNLPDVGEHCFSYALYPHTGDWREAASDRRGVEFNQPLVAAVTDVHDGVVAPARAMLACEPSNVMVTALKLAEDGSNAVVIRLAEMHGEPAEALLACPWELTRCESTNPLEDPGDVLPVDGNKVQIALKPHQVQTLKLYRA